MFLYESQYHTKEVGLHDKNNASSLIDLINDGGQLSWTLTLPRIQQKLSHSGKLFGLYLNEKPVGVIAIKLIEVDGIKGGEIGYLYIDPDHRSLQTATQLYNIALKSANQYPFLMASTITTNRAVNTLLEKSEKMHKIFTAKSPYSSNKLNYWLSSINSGAFTIDEITEVLKNEYGNNIISESLNEDVSFVNIDNAPITFKNDVVGLIKRQSTFHASDSVDEKDINIVFGRQEGLPKTKNTIFVGNKFLSKDKQYEMVKNIVPTIKTFDSSDDLDNFIAKKKSGHKQQGQLINQQPDDSSDYVFQPKLEIIAEYRVVVYYMNGSYHVSGVYKKMGSNASMQSITSGVIYDTAASMAMKSTKVLGYGLSGVDVAIVTRDDNINESMGDMFSAAGKTLGKFSKSFINDDEIMVFLEANTMPSMSNPMILNDILKNAMKNKEP